MIQIIKEILQLHKDNVSKYKMQFYNEYFFYEGKRLSKPLCKKKIIIAPFLLYTGVRIAFRLCFRQYQITNNKYKIQNVAAYVLWY